MNHRPYLRSLFLVATGIIAFSLFGANVQAVSLHPDVVRKLRAEGTLDECIAQMNEARAKGVWGAPEHTIRNSLSMDSASEPQVVRLLVILVDFDDNQWQTGADGTVEFFEKLLFSQGELPYGSMKEYYLENSYGKFILTGEVYGWYRMPQNYSYYVNGQAGFGSYPRNAQKMAEDAVLVANDDINYAEYDSDGNGSVEGLIVIHAGEGRETSGSMNDINSHNWSMRNVQNFDGVHLSSYSTVPEEQSDADGLVNIGVICHEFGHQGFGLPDLYDTDYSSSGVSKWSIMASGSWNGGGERPAHFDAWSKYWMGFVQPINIAENELGHVFPPVEDSPHVVQMWANGVPTSQYFLLEYRKKTGYDALLPGEGLLIYYIDEGQSGNSNEEHYKVAVMQADGRFDLENNRSADGGDPWPGTSYKTEFSDRTVPDTRSYAGTITQVGVWDITDYDDSIMADLDVRFSRPLFHCRSSSFDDSNTGNGNDTLELGETVEFYFEIENEWADAENVTCTLTPLDQRIQPVIGSIVIDMVRGLNAVTTNDGNPLSFHIPGDMDSVRVRFQLTIAPSGLGDTAVYETAANIGGTKVLIVADDGGDLFGQYADYYTDALDSLNYTYEVWDKEELGSPGTWQLVYPMIIWFTGDSRTSSFTSDDVQFLSQFLDLGGGLFLTGQDVAQHLSAVDPSFLSDYMRCSYGGSFSEVQYNVHGVAGSAIAGDSLELSLNFSSYAAENQTSADSLVAQNQDDVCLTYVNGSTAGIEVEGDFYRAVLFGFGFENISGFYIYNTRVDVITRVLNYLNGRQSLGNRPPNPFSLIYPADGDTIQTDTISLIWHSSFDFDGGDQVSYEVYYTTSDTSSWQNTTVISDTVFLLSGLQVDSRYYWKVMASDNHGLATSSSETLSFQSTGDITPPSFVLNPIPNSVFPFEFDLMVYPSEPLQGTPVLTVTPPSGSDVNEPLDLLGDRSALVYAAHYTVTASGSYDFEVCGTDGVGLYGCSDAGLSLAPVHEGKGTFIRSSSGIFDLTIPNDAVGNDAVLIVNEMNDNQTVPDGFNLLTAVQIKSYLLISKPAQLSVDLDQIDMTGIDRNVVGLLRLNDNEDTVIPTRYDEKSNRLVADIDEFGIYALVSTKDGQEFDHDVITPSSFALGQNWPNPFNISTSISFDLPVEAQVSLVVYNLLGQKVVTLMDAYANAGHHIVNWDGRSSSGEVVSSGIYFYRIRTDAFTETKRMMLLK